jgi:hypothetical protein
MTTGISWFPPNPVWGWSWMKTRSNAIATTDTKIPLHSTLNTKYLAL